MSPLSSGRWWARKDIARIRQRLEHGNGLTDAERAYLRNWSLLLLASDLDLDDEDRTRLRWLVHMVDADSEREGVA